MRLSDSPAVERHVLQKVMQLRYNGVMWQSQQDLRKNSNARHPASAIVSSRNLVVVMSDIRPASLSDAGFVTVAAGLQGL